MASPNPRDEGEDWFTSRRRVVGHSRTVASWGLRLAAFWASVLLPFVALAVLLTGMESPWEWQLLGGLLAANLVSLYLGHPHTDD